MTPTEILPFFLLIFATGVAIGWMLGNNHGIEIGREIGAADEILASRRRCIQHKRDSFKLGCITTIARLLNGEPVFQTPTTHRGGQRCQAVGREPEGKVPTIALAAQRPPLWSNTAPEGDERQTVSARNTFPVAQLRGFRTPKTEQ